MTLPAHRFLHRKKEQPTAPFVFCWDVDDTITSAPRQHVRLAEAVKALGDKVVIVTGHGPKATREELLNAIGFPFDEIVIVDPGAYGEGKREALETLGAFFLFDDKIMFGPEVLKACPVTFQYTEPPGDDHAVKDAKKAAKALKRNQDASQDAEDGGQSGRL